LPRYTRCETCDQKIRARNFDKHKFRVHRMTGKKNVLDEPISQVRAIKYHGERIATLGYGFARY
jgi:hypothetical protein